MPGLSEATMALLVNKRLTESIQGTAYALGKIGHLKGELPNKWV